MSANIQEITNEYGQQREKILADLRTITNRATFAEPNRKHLNYYKQLTAQSVNVYFDNALDSFKIIAPEVSHLRRRVNKKDQQKREAAIKAEIQKRLEFLKDLAPVVQKICLLQADLLDNPKNIELAQTTLQELNASIEALKKKHNDSFLTSKLYTKLGLGLAIFGAVLFMALPSALMAVD